MTTSVEAVYSGGVLRLLEALHLPEEQRVRVTIETIDPGTSPDRQAAMQRLMERLDRSTLSYGGALPSRDELHERVGHV